MKKGKQTAKIKQVLFWNSEYLQKSLICAKTHIQKAKNRSFKCKRKCYTVNKCLHDQFKFVDETKMPEKSKKMNKTVQNTDKNDLSYATFKYKKELRFFRQELA